MGKYSDDAKKLLEYVGGKQNISAVTHCMTRMRFVLADPEKADVAKIEALKSVKGTFTQAGQFQVIIGNDVSVFYNEFTSVSGIEGVSKEEVKQEAADAGMTVEEYAAAGYEAPEQDSFSIYQIKSGDETRDYRFEPFDRLQATGRSVDRANYDLVYTAPLDSKTTLEDIYRTFNIDHPADFKGHSLSVSDVVVLHQGGKDTAHYCESFGFQQVPEFLRENPLRTAKLSTEQNENMIDGVINNTPSMGELEAKVKAGEQISLTDLADATKAEAKKPKAKQSRKTQQKKPSIRAQLKVAQEEQAKKKPAREKSQELEV